MPGKLVKVLFRSMRAAASPRPSGQLPPACCLLGLRQFPGHKFQEFSSAHRPLPASFSLLPFQVASCCCCCCCLLPVCHIITGVFLPVGQGKGGRAKRQAQNKKEGQRAKEGRKARARKGRRRHGVLTCANTKYNYHNHHHRHCHHLYSPPSPLLIDSFSCHVVFID